MVADYSLSRPAGGRSPPAMQKASTRQQVEGQLPLRLASLDLILLFKALVFIRHLGGVASCSQHGALLQ